MSSINLATTIHICEDTDGTFDIRDILANVGYTPNAGNTLKINAVSVVLPDGTVTSKDSPLFGKVDADTLYVRPGQWAANYNGEFVTYEFVLDQGTKGNTITLSLRVVVDPVNDAPTGADKIFNLDNGSPVALTQADFGFVDTVEHDMFQSVIITALPTAGVLKLDGVAVTLNTEISAADIQAGKLSFEPSQSTAGAFEIGFKVRDAGGLVGCGAADTSATSNYLTFKVPPAHLGDLVWEDVNGNGLQDTGEAGIDGVIVNLKDADGNIVASVTTHDGGQYDFTVDPGTYSVAVAPPAGYVFAAASQGANGALDSDVGANGQASVVLAPGQNNLDIDAGLYRPASLSEFVWFDKNRDGLVSDGETGAAGVRVTLLDANGNAVPGAVATTDANGHYQFTGLQPGAYSVQFDKATLPAGYSLTTASTGAPGSGGSDASVDTGTTGKVTLASGDDVTVRAGLVAQKATIGDRVWEDSNANGVQDVGEAGITGATVQLKDSTGNVVQTTTTGADGKYSFSADAGTYTVAVTAPKGYVFSGANAGGDASLDSNVGSTGQSGQITLANGEVNNTIDAGLYKTASVGDRVWFDKNGNGVQDSGEAGICNVKVTLLDAAGKPVGAAVYTDANGNYQFTNLKPGAYSVQFDKSTLPEGMGFTTANVGSNDNIDSDVNASGLSHSFTLASGEVNKSVDAGVVGAATIGDRVWLDKNGNGIQDTGESGKSGVTMELRDSTGKLVKTTTTDSNGNYKFAVEAGTYSVAMKLPNGFAITRQNAGSSDALDSDANASGNLGSVTVAAGQNVTSMDAGIYQTGAIGDRVWHDANGDGIQQSNEAGVRGVKVTLLNETGKAIATDVTDAYGQYLFADVGPGKYSVKFDAPDGYLFTKQNQGYYDSSDSDADANGLISQFTLASGAVDLSRDAGLVKASSIGDRVWEDTNYNGVQDAGEKGVDGVTVKLYDANNVLKATTVTHDGGQYLFGGLAAGNYKVEVTNSAGWFFTKSGMGTDATDSDITSVNGSTGRTGTIALGKGQNITTEDAGIYRKASIGDKVWRDSNHNGLQEAGEEGISGITVSLYDAATRKQLGASVKTDANGNYKFADLTPGKYYVEFNKAEVIFKGVNMSTWKWGVKNTGTNDTVDSDVAGDGQMLNNITKTDIITLTSGKNDMSWDAAITPIAIDLNGDGIHTIAREDMAGSFDLLGTGKAIQTGWLSGDDGFLAIDGNHNGRIDDISELFGGMGKGDGFAKLASFDSNGDGVVDGLDRDFASLLIWQDANSDGKTGAGELVSLAQAGVVSLKLAYTDLAFLDANNNLHMESSTVTLATGHNAAMTDVYFNVAASDAADAGITAPTIDQLIADAAQVQLVGQCPVYMG
ncbi:SdrD B-like domain-containing protein [Duganella phyllosphaerae]|uniref:Serine-aspartate repeat-containing protein D n=1 Tax=Duganella phyllosphaerae TaxID=762836 RepID=A0A1E7W6E8_9BURK|nr:SdrD B-like domain-containing protein [Duganella phyllosphaerae]OEZ91580.1 serine-aspartate repeat-containing protein D precursor [Duganella phyllosphaerae]